MKKTAGRWKLWLMSSARNTLQKAMIFANKNDMTALFRIGYGLYVVTSNDGKRTTV